MPPKRNKKFKAKAKEEILVTSRLMTISLVVDDYIYKNKAISLLEAMKFDEEITSLKIKCNRDTRSLQVVEKLKIFMKSIIKEQSTDRFQDNTSNLVTETCVDNSTLITLNDLPEVIENNITYSPQTNTTELFKNRESENSELDNITQDINTEKKVSINIINPVISVSTEIKHVESNDITTPNNLILKLNDKSEEIIISTSKNIDFVKNVCLANTVNEKELPKSDLATLTSNLQKPPEQEKPCLIQENQKPNEIATGIKKQRKTNKKTCNKNKITPKNNIKTNANLKNRNKDLEKKFSGANKPKKKPKKKTQVNFSWVENLMYVREVSQDEHTDLQIEDNFWSNLSLPGVWNSNDFD